RGNPAADRWCDRRDLGVAGAVPVLWTRQNAADRAALSRHQLRMKNRLPLLRDKQGWSQGDLAERLDVSRQTINAIETGKYDPSLPLGFKMAKLFRQPIESIFEPGKE